MQSDACPGPFNDPEECKVQPADLVALGWAAPSQALDSAFANAQMLFSLPTPLRHPDNQPNVQLSPLCAPLHNCHLDNMCVQVMPSYDGGAAEGLVNMRRHGRAVADAPCQVQARPPSQVTSNLAASQGLAPRASLQTRDGDCNRSVAQRTSSECMVGEVALVAASQLQPRLTVNKADSQKQTVCNGTGMAIHVDIVPQCPRKLSCSHTLHASMPLAARSSQSGPPEHATGATAIQSSAASQKDKFLSVVPETSVSGRSTTEKTPDPEWLVIDMLEICQTSCAVKRAEESSQMPKRKIAVCFLEDTKVDVQGSVDSKHSLKAGMYEGRVLEVCPKHKE
jgi:hypothetical protein